MEQDKEFKERDKASLDLIRAQMAQQNLETASRNLGPWTADASSMQVPPFLSPYQQYQQQQGGLTGGIPSSQGLVKTGPAANPFSQTWQFGGNSTGGFSPRQNTSLLTGGEPVSPQQPTGPRESTHGATQQLFGTGESTPGSKQPGLNKDKGHMFNQQPTKPVNQPGANASNQSVPSPDAQQRTTMSGVTAKFPFASARQHQAWTGGVFVCLFFFIYV